MAKDPYRYFRIEAQELLEQLGKGVLDLEKSAGAPALVPRLLRLTHTFKGAARVVKQREIADQAHAIEGMLAPFRDERTTVPRERIDAVLRLLDGIGGLVSTLALPAGDAAAHEGSGPDSGPRPAPTGTPHAGAAQTVRADIAEMDGLLDGLAETHSRLRSLRAGLNPMERARHLAHALAEQRSPRLRREGGHAPAGDGAHAMADELRGILGRFERGLSTSLDQMDRELRQVRTLAQQLRLVPAQTLFTALERAARDAAQALGKEVAFEGRGGAVRLDAPVLDVVQGALLQVVNNAVAHGIEPGAQRLAAGKPARGRVTLEVQRRGTRIAFICSDDGAGIDLEAVRHEARRKGLLPAQGGDADEQALLGLLLGGGISTSAAVTEVSGRGIGLDLAREAAQRLGGDVHVSTAARQGTRVELQVPLSMASVQVLVVQCEGISVAIALDAVRRSLRLPAAHIARAAQGETLLHDGAMIPFLALTRALGHDTQAAHDPRPARAAWSVLVIEGAAGVAAIGIDRVAEATSVVLRPLPALAPASPLVAGAFLDADGNPQLVLDTNALVALALRADAPAPQPERLRHCVLVVDDSLTTRMLEQSILESAGFEVDLAASAEEALEQTRRKDYALFLVDVEMPGMDGFTFIERVRADPALQRIPAMLVTSRASAQDRQRGAAAGAQGYIVKSEFDQSDFLGQIHRLVARA